MNDSPKVSIIIPVYDVEPYIMKCLLSVYSQTYKNLEVIIVNDCSSDNSMHIAKTIVADKGLIDGVEVKLIEHDWNKGVAATRNTGMKTATGEYIFFIDSDDYLPDNSIESLVRLAIKYPGVDIVHGNYQYAGTRYGWLDLNNKKFPEYVNDHQWIIDHILKSDWDGLYGTVTNKLIRREMILQYDMWFKEGIIHEDEYWKFMYADKWSSIAFCTDCTYNYFLRDNSITMSINDKAPSNLIMLSAYREFLHKPLHLSKENYKDFVIKVLRCVYENGIVDYKLYSVKLKQTMREFASYEKLPYNVRLCFYYMSLPRFFVRKKVVSLLV